MSKKEVQKDEVTAEALQKILHEQESKILTLVQETERVKRNSRIMLASFIIVVLIVAGVVSAAVFWKPTPTLTWHEVSRFSGAFKEFETNDTDVFRVSSDRWRIYWYVNSDFNSSANAPPEDVEFRLFLEDRSMPPLYTLREGHNFFEELAWLKLTDFSGSKGQGVDWFYERNAIEYITGPGEFRFHLLGASLKWEIVVEAYY